MEEEEGERWRFIGRRYATLAGGVHFPVDTLAGIDLDDFARR